MNLRRPLRRFHIWLGWLVGVPILFWTLSGLWMVARPIDEVRGSALRRDPVALGVAGAVVLPAAGAPLRSLTLEPQSGRTVWIARFVDGRVARAEPASGRWLPPVDAGTAAAIARAAYRSSSPIAGVRRFSAVDAPLDLRQSRPSWQIAFADGTHLYVDADSGSVLALRTRQWRAFDWMWGLHIMDLGGREDTHHPLLIGFAVLALAMTVLALTLLPMTARRRR